MVETYTGVLLGEGFKSGRTPCKLELDASQLRIQHNESEETWPLPSLSLEIGGSGNRLVYLKSSTNPTLTAYVTDLKILKSPLLEAQPQLRQHMGQVKSKRNVAKLATIGVLGFIILMFYSIFLFKSSIVSGIASTIPQESKEKLGQKILDKFLVDKHIIEHELINDPLEEATSHLINHQDFLNYNIKIFIIEDSTINAFAVPGGFIVLNSGLIDKAENWDEVLGVMAHELAHISKQHSIRRVLETLGSYTIITSLFGDFSGLFGVLVENSSFFFMQSYSRDFEREADAVGYSYLVQAGLNPSGLKTFFEKIKEEHHNNEVIETFEKSLSLLSTHPATNERIHTLEKQLIDFKPIKKRPDLPNFLDWKTEVIRYISN